MTDTSDHTRLCERLREAADDFDEIVRVIARLAAGTKAAAKYEGRLVVADGSREMREAATLIESQAQQIATMEAENIDLRKIMDAICAKHEGQMAAVNLLTTPTILTREMLEKLREPTDEMIEAGFRIDTSDTPSFEEALAIAFTAMIDEAIRALSNAPGEKG